MGEKIKIDPLLIIIFISVFIVMIAVYRYI